MSDLTTLEIIIERPLFKVGQTIEMKDGSVLTIIDRIHTQTTILHDGKTVGGRWIYGTRSNDKRHRHWRQHDLAAFVKAHAVTVQE